MPYPTSSCCWGDFLTLRTIDSFEWDVASLPVGKEPAMILHGVGVCIANASEHKDEAWAFVEFVNLRKGKQHLARRGALYRR